mmetsp:Transcript_112554/g.314498  ORF Transcript_112554/g.314498 Transcript_112554/m.314498 type:complete len:97 (+) Transcript_112554:932-1222(+)
MSVTPDMTTSHVPITGMFGGRLRNLRGPDGSPPAEVRAPMARRPLERMLFTDIVWEPGVCAPTAGEQTTSATLLSLTSLVTAPVASAAAGSAGTPP